MRGAGGFAQLVVLWALLLLGALALSFSFSMRTEALAARNSLDSSRAYYQARTGINRAIALLSANAVDNVLAAPLAGDDEDASYETRVVGEGGKIDINFVPEELLKDVLRNGGLSAEDAEGVGDSILDWREDGDAPRPNGAKDAYYAALPEPIRVRRGKLQALEELSSVKGVTGELYARFLSRVFTVHGLSRSVDINAAPPEVLRVLPGFTPEAADAVVARRRERPFGSPAEAAAFLGEAGISLDAIPVFSTSRSVRVYTITSVGKAGPGIVRGIECQVELGGAAAKRVRMLRWTDYAAVGEGA